MINYNFEQNILYLFLALFVLVCDAAFSDFAGGEIHGGGIRGGIY